LSIGSDLYVVKHFFETGSGEQVAVEENKACLESELIWLKIAEWFLSKFKAQAKEASVEYSSGPLISYNFNSHLCTPIKTSWYLKAFLYEKIC